ncbi:hypothetical protein BD324DRAFT_118908 [Kockovaella imperatae]|uniref:Uncharacterized protein n=1 Tax=Kockovaella imperatae TaxID=4999 RepID=A0A1Y1UC58_9TREE|nr:hypothetical protein BD324DRAFT_118908 [Kockovaella imperatae]ORX35117.1 hypothetical protein BD324DRAFT_118908 [Kockovaella imperatae]
MVSPVRSLRLIGFWLLSFIAVAHASQPRNHAHTPLRKGRRGSHGLDRRDDTVIWNAGGPSTDDLRTTTADLMVEDSDIKAILFVLTKLTHGKWIMDLMGQPVPLESDAPLNAYSGSQAAYSIYDSTFYRHQVNISVSGTGPVSVIPPCDRQSH